MAIKKGTLDELLSGRDPKQVFSKDGLFDELKKALAERVLNAELDEHLDGEAAAGKANHRNGYSKKTVLTGSAKLDLRIPRDREGTFDPKLIARYQRRFPGFDEKIVSMYARGMTAREIQGRSCAERMARSRTSRGRESSQALRGHGPGGTRNRRVRRALAGGDARRARRPAEEGQHGWLGKLIPRSPRRDQQALHQETASAHCGISGVAPFSRRNCASLRGIA
jgi:hypothetical protein